MQVISTGISDVKLIQPHVHGDERGFFMETWNARAFEEAGLDLHFVQDNHSKSAAKVLRGLHYQVNSPQGKLVRVVVGAVFDVAVDLRRSSSTFGKWVGFELSAHNRRQLWIPEGFAHGFVTLEDETEFVYKCTALYEPVLERSVRWNDPALNIAWPVREPMLSAKDAAAPVLAAAETFA